ncbi:general secretion pathway protein [Moraxella sp. PS-22]|uniref:General secretion pathway protein n=2 Tax=Moraxella tetraodonis TaxID=2767221 RepID=A0A9X1UQR7_9GAMM|nr:general secretion pathway protein [Moraxella tetraodonis]
MIKATQRTSLSRKTTTGKLVPMAVVEKLYPWLLLAAIFWLVWQLSQAIWLVVAPPKAPVLTPVPLQPNLVAQSANTNALDFFAQPTAPQAPAATPPDIKVVGVTIATPESQSYAILTANGKTLSYRINDMIDGSGYKLVKVAADFVMVADASGQTSKVPFGQPFFLDQSEAIRAKAQANGAAGVGNGSNMGQTPTPSLGGAATQAIGGAPVATSDPHDREDSAPNIAPSNAANTSPSGASSAIGGAIQGLQQNASGYLSQMGVAATGQGYLVTDAMSAGLKNRLGLQTGDKVLSVNGQNVGQNPTQDAQLLRQVQQAGQAQIQVQRGDQVVTVRQSF